jgi:two-component system sensor kinase
VNVRIKRGFGPLPPATDIALFRIVQEALTNIHRHSKSPVANIFLESVRGKVRVTVEDRGVGMPLASVATGGNPPMGIGIAAMRERVKQLGGVFNIQSQPGRGTTVIVELPLSPPEKTAGKKRNGTIRGRKDAITSKLVPDRG